MFKVCHYFSKVLSLFVQRYLISLFDKQWIDPFKYLDLLYFGLHLYSCPKTRKEGPISSFWWPQWLYASMCLMGQGLGWLGKPGGSDKVIASFMILYRIDLSILDYKCQSNVHGSQTVKFICTTVLFEF